MVTLSHTLRRVAERSIARLEQLVRRPFFAWESDTVQRLIMHGVPPSAFVVCPFKRAGGVHPPNMPLLAVRADALDLDPCQETPSQIARRPWVKQTMTPLTTSHPIA